MSIEITNALIKEYAALATSKGRKESRLFMAQGTKCVLDTMSAFQIERVMATAAWSDEHSHVNCDIVKPRDIQRISSLSTPPQVIAIYKIPADEYDDAKVRVSLNLALDCIQDPGNLGTIMRVCDWMGVTDIFASPDTADVWNPKVVQATMGAISRVRVHYVDLPAFLRDHSEMPICGTFLGGENIYAASLPENGIIVMGNEGKGISAPVAELANVRLTIPPYPTGHESSESLNVAVATSIVLSEFRRTKLK